ncbi:MAG: site-2 protease family protein [Candidatus Aminicenantales bacterium]
MKVTPIFFAMEEEERENRFQPETPYQLRPFEERPFSFFSGARIWLNVVLFVVTVFSTFFVGISHSLSFEYGEVLSRNPDLNLDLSRIITPEIIYLSIIYAVVLIGILLGHEFGHYLACRHYSINATLPYFIPAPTLIGTLGAFIKIKSPITRKQHLFDIGIAGPLTGFILSFPALAYGLSLSKVVPPLPEGGAIMFGEPLLLKILGTLVIKDIPSGYDVLIHPIAFAGWVGILVTSFNLFPVGQLDGGHISYALFGQKSGLAARVFLYLFFFMGVVFWVGWFIWAFIILVLGMKHPRIIDEATPLSPRRKIMAFVALLIFILSFIPAPIKGYSLLDIFK